MMVDKVVRQLGFVLKRIEIRFSCFRKREKEGRPKPERLRPAVNKTYELFTEYFKGICFAVSYNGYDVETGCGYFDGSFGCDGADCIHHDAGCRIYIHCRL